MDMELTHFNTHVHIREKTAMLTNLQPIFPASPGGHMAPIRALNRVTGGRSQNVRSLIMGQPRKLTRAAFERE